MNRSTPHRGILLVDDDDQLMTLLNLSDGGGDLLIYKSSVELALASIYESSFDLILLNIEMSGAFELLEKIRQQNQPVCLIISSSPESIAVARFISYDFLMRPFDTERVLSQLKKWFGQADTILLATP